VRSCDPVCARVLAWVRACGCVWVGVMCVQEMRGHSSYINHCTYTVDGDVRSLNTVYISTAHTPSTVTTLLRA
jgi:hypothetical protein